MINGNFANKNHYMQVMHRQVYASDGVNVQSFHELSSKMRPVAQSY